MVHAGLPREPISMAQVDAAHKDAYLKVALDNAPNPLLQMMRSGNALNRRPHEPLPDYYRRYTNATFGGLI